MIKEILEQDQESIVGGAQAGKETFPKGIHDRNRYDDDAGFNSGVFNSVNLDDGLDNSVVNYNKKTGDNESGIFITNGQIIQFGEEFKLQGPPLT